MNRIKSADFIGLFTKDKLSNQEFAQLRSLIDAAAQPDEDKILRYLSAPLVLDATQFFMDQFQQGRPIRCFVTKSDGVWAWSNALEYYVEEYHFRVPPEFVEHMRSRNWLPPQATDLDWDDIAKRHYIWDEKDSPSL